MNLEIKLDEENEKGYDCDCMDNTKGRIECD